MPSGGRSNLWTGTLWTPNVNGVVQWYQLTTEMSFDYLLTQELNARPKTTDK